MISQKKIKEEYEMKERYAMKKAERMGELILLDKQQLIDMIWVFETVYGRDLAKEKYLWKVLK